MIVNAQSPIKTAHNPYKGLTDRSYVAYTATETERETLVSDTRGKRTISFNVKGEGLESILKEYKHMGRL